ncbi:BgTH12-06277 [Blumeria graminis f. sp. triticale]|uniref:BgTH12-06277 n=1 Tax=Blumeria graminis f. sp. triticale TaxID=1689686 RepID=A0A9W4D261_BLUGR|nr:BgTH12-06277 [Blumeria graminis f. sp. triticale]
MTEGSLFP